MTFLESPPYGIVTWNLNPTNTITEPPTGEFRVDSVTAPTGFAVSETDRLGVDQETEVLAQVIAGDRLVVQQVRSAGRYWVFDVDTPTDQGAWWEIPITDTIGGTISTLIDGQDYIFAFRHAADLASDDDAPLPPAGLVPADDRATLIADVVEALTLEVKADPVRDADRLERSATAAVENVERYLDSGTVLFAYATLPATVMSSLVQIAAGDLKRPGFAMGLAGYDDADPMAVRAYGAIRAELHTYKARWGVA